VDNQDVSDQPTPEQRIWQVVAMIPRGKVATYGQIAMLAGMPRHARLVGRTLSNLPAKTRLPWHRVINASMKISYRESGSKDVQRKRLEKEGITFVGGRVPQQHAWDT
jgi:methylated-DNA-protein-cysteine methyltransferase-like protein